MMACAWIQGKGNKVLRIGLYLFTIMNWMSCVGFTMFPLSDSGYAGTFQDVMHMVLTAGVVILSVASLICLIVGSRKNQEFRILGIAERFSVFAAVGYNGVLGIWLLGGKKRKEG